MAQNALSASIHVRPGRRAERRRRAGANVNAETPACCARNDRPEMQSAGLPAEEVGEDEWGDDGGVGLDDETRSVGGKFAPGDFFVGNGTGVGAVAGGGVADLAEVGPEGNVFAAQILVEHGDDTDGEVAGDAAANLEKTERMAGGELRVPTGELDHVLDAGAHGADVFDFAADDLRSEHVAESGIFPARNENGEIFLRGGEHPTVPGIDLVELCEFAFAENFEQKLMREAAAGGGVGGAPLFGDDAFDAAHGFFFGDASVGDAV